MSRSNQIFRKKPSGDYHIDSPETATAMVIFMGSDDLDELQAILEKNPALLSPEADDMLKQISERLPKNYLNDLLGISESDRIQSVISNERKRALLARCRQVGIEKAFSEARKQKK